MQPKCPKCGETTWSISDKKYLKQNGQCWECDEKDYTSGKLSLGDFEKREKQSLSESRVGTVISGAGSFSLN